MLVTVANTAVTPVKPIAFKKYHEKQGWGGILGTEFVYVPNTPYGTWVRKWCPSVAGPKSRLESVLRIWVVDVDL